MFYGNNSQQQNQGGFLGGNILTPIALALMASDKNGGANVANAMGQIMQMRDSQANRALQEKRLALEQQRYELEAQLKSQAAQMELDKVNRYKQAQDQLSRLIGRPEVTPGQVQPGQTEMTPLMLKHDPGEGVLSGKITPEQFNLMAAPAFFQAGDTGSALNLINKGAGDAFTLSPGQSRYNAAGKLIAQGGIDASKSFDDTSKLRGEFINQSKDFKQVSDSYARILAAGENPSAAGDLALIFNYMKMLDPGSTVREGEFANAQNSAGIPERLRGMYNNVVSGKRLSTTQRSDFINRSGSLYDSQSGQQENLESQYKKFAEQNNLDSKNVLIDYRVNRNKTKQNANNIKNASPEQIQNWAQEAINKGADPALVQQELKKLRGY